MSKLMLNKNKNQIHNLDKTKFIRYSCVASLAVFALVFFGLAMFNTPKSDARSSSMDGFDAGNIIDDAVFYNPNTMTVDEIQALMDREVPACDMWGEGSVGGRRYPDGSWVPAGTTRAQYAKVMRERFGKSHYHEPPYVCVDMYYQNPETGRDIYDSKGKVENGMISSAQIVYNAAHEYGVNPQVLLVMLAKESLNWRDNWPLHYEYNTVMGYGCPDGAPCASEYFGFYNQVNKAAWQMKYYREHIYSYNYRPGMTNNILYHPNRGCGTKPVDLVNSSTTSLYIYTPYTPNEAALDAYPGEGDGCSSYGNRNFYGFFKEWFGEPRKSETAINGILSEIEEGTYEISSVSNEGGVLTAEPLDKQHNVLATQKQEKPTNRVIFDVKKSVAENYYTITNVEYSKNLDVLEASSDDGANIQLWEANGSCAQDWAFYKNQDDEYMIISRCSGKPAGVHGDNVELAPITNVSSQRWRLAKATVVEEEPSIPTPAPEIKYSISEGDYLVTNSSRRNLVVDLDGANIQVGDNRGSKSQRWHITHASAEESNGQELYYLESNNSGKYLGINSDSVSSGKNVELIAKKSCATRWKIASHDDGSYILRSSCNEEQVLDITGAIMHAGTNIQVWEFHNDAAQFWRLEKMQPLIDYKVDEGVYVIKSKDYPELVIDVKFANTSMDADIWTYDRNDTTAQRWQITHVPVDDSEGAELYYIKSVLSGYYLSAGSPNVQNGSDVALSTKVGCAQKWKIDEASDGSLIFRNSCNEQQVIDVTNANMTYRVELQTWEWHGSVAQKWAVEKVSDVISHAVPEGEYVIKNFYHPNLVLDVKFAGDKSGTNVWLYDYNASGAQKWQIRHVPDAESDGQELYYIKSKLSDNYLSIEGGRANGGANVQISSGKSCAEKWKIANNEDGSVQLQSSCDNNQVVDIVRAEMWAQTNIQVWRSHRDPAQYWKLERL